MMPFWPEGQRIRVRGGDAGPLSFWWRIREHRICDTSAHWRIHTDWWSDAEIWRDYWEVTTKSGLLCVLYRDLRRDLWYLERIYE